MIYLSFSCRTPSSKPLLDARDLLEELCNLHPCRLRGSAGGLAVHPLRGPFLGRLELIKQVTLNGVQNVVELRETHTHTDVLLISHLPPPFPISRTLHTNDGLFQCLCY